MSTHNIGFYEDLTKMIFQLSSNIIKYATYLFFCRIQEGHWSGNNDRMDTKYWSTAHKIDDKAFSRNATTTTTATPPKPTVIAVTLSPPVNLDPLKPHF